MSHHGIGGDESVATATPAGSDDLTQVRTRGTVWSTALKFLGKYGTLVVLVLSILVFSIMAPSTFPSLSNFVDILNQNAIGAIVAGGLTMALVVGEFDLSIGYAASLAGMLVTGLITNQGLPVWLAIVIVLILGLVVGFINGIVVTKLGVNALIGTLGTGTVLVGINYAYSSGIPISVPPSSSFPDIALGSVFGIPNPILIAAVVLLALWIVLNKTSLGQSLQAVGGNAEAARLSGIRNDRVRISAFVLAGFCAMLTGVLLASRLDSGQVTAGDGYTLASFAACFLGAAALRDGQFHIVGTVIGIVTVGVGFTGLVIVGAPTYYQYLFEGLLLVLAVALSTVARRYGRGAG